MQVNAARLLPHEIVKRRVALALAYGNPPPAARLAADGSGVAGVNSTPAPAKTALHAADLPPAALSPAVFCPGVVCVVSYDEARQWAVQNGLCKFRKALDLTAVNAARRDMRLAPFALKGQD